MLWQYTMLTLNRHLQFNIYLQNVTVNQVLDHTHLWVDYNLAQHKESKRLLCLQTSAVARKDGLSNTRVYTDKQHSIQLLEDSMVCLTTAT